MPNITSKICHQRLCATSADMLDNILRFQVCFRDEASQRLAHLPGGDNPKPGWQGIFAPGPHRGGRAAPPGQVQLGLGGFLL